MFKDFKCSYKMSKCNQKLHQIFETNIQRNLEHKLTLILVSLEEKNLEYFHDTATKELIYLG